jgi:hypothetical protein
MLLTVAMPGEREGSMRQVRAPPLLKKEKGQLFARLFVGEAQTDAMMALEACYQVLFKEG